MRLSGVIEAPLPVECFFRVRIVSERRWRCNRMDQDWHGCSIFVAE
jgi:hypothetical protein